MFGERSCGFFVAIPQILSFSYFFTQFMIWRGEWIAIMFEVIIMIGEKAFSM